MHPRIFDNLKTIVFYEPDISNLVSICWPAMVGEYIVKWDETIKDCGICNVINVQLMYHESHADFFLLKKVPQ